MTVQTSSDVADAGHPSDLILGGGANLRILTGIEVYADEGASLPSFCVQAQGTYVWYPEQVNTYLLSAKQIENTMVRLAELKKDAECDDSSTWSQKGSATNDCKWVTADTKRCDDDAAVDASGVTAKQACKKACENCRSTLSDTHINQIQAGIDNWVTVLSNARTVEASSIKTLQGHINAVLLELDTTYSNFLSDMDNPEEFSEYLRKGMATLQGRTNTFGMKVGLIDFGYPLSDYESLKPVVKELGDLVKLSKDNCESKTIFTDPAVGETAATAQNTCSVYADMDADLQFAEDSLFGLCGPTVEFKTDAHERFCKTYAPPEGEAAKLPSRALDALSAAERYISFGHGETMTLKYDMVQSSTMAQVAKYDSNAKFQDAPNRGTKANANVMGAAVESSYKDDDFKQIKVNIGRGAKRNNKYTHSVEIHLNDPDAGDTFTVKIEEDAVHGTPIFTTMGGESTCPGETATTRRADMTKIFDVIPHCNIVNPKIKGKGFEPTEGQESCKNLPPGTPAYFGVVLQNTMKKEETTQGQYQRYKIRALNNLASWNKGMDYYDAQFSCEKDGYGFGLEIDTVDKNLPSKGNLGMLANRVPVGQHEFLIKVEQGADAHCSNFKNVFVELLPECAHRRDYQYQEKLDGTEVKVVYPLWQSDSFCNASSDATCVSNTFKPDTTPNLMLVSTGYFSVSWADCSADADDPNWRSSVATAGAAQSCFAVAENPAHRCPAWASDAGEAATKACKVACCGYPDQVGSTRRLLGGAPDALKASTRAPVTANLLVLVGLFFPTLFALVLANRRNKRLADILRGNLLERATRLMKNLPHDEVLAVVLDNPALPLDEVQAAIAALESRALVL